MAKMNLPKVWWNLLILMLAGGLSACGGGGGGAGGGVAAGAGTDTTAPVVSLVPPPARVNAATLLLEGGVDEVSTVTVTPTGPAAVLGQVSYPTATRWQIEVTAMEDGNHTFTIVATDGSGNASQALVAEVVQDSVAPTLALEQVDPGSDGTNIDILQPIRFTFNEAMKSNTLTTADPAPTVLVVDDIGPVPGVVTGSDGLTFTFTPDESYASDSVVQVTVTTGATDLAGNPLVEPVIWSFRTNNAPPPPPL